MMAYRQYFYNA